MSSENEEQVISEDEESESEIDTLDLNLQLILSINNELVRTTNLLQKVNTELMKMVSNLTNMTYVCNKKIDEVQKNIE